MNKKRRAVLLVKWLLLGFILSIYAIGLILYPLLSYMVPSYWNISGHVYGYMYNIPSLRYI